MQPSLHQLDDFSNNKFLICKVEKHKLNQIRTVLTCIQNRQISYFEYLKSKQIKDGKHLEMDKCTFTGNFPTLGAVAFRCFPSMRRKKHLSKIQWNTFTKQVKIDKKLHGDPVRKIGVLAREFRVENWKKIIIGHSCILYLPIYQ